MPTATFRLAWRNRARAGETMTPFLKPHSGITAMERSVLACAEAGMTIKETATALNMAFQTAASHRKHILQKMGVNTIIKAALKFRAEFPEAALEIVASRRRAA